jgi:hypothetical protein
VPLPELSPLGSPLPSNIWACLEAEHRSIASLSWKNLSLPRLLKGLRWRTLKHRLWWAHWGIFFWVLGRCRPEQWEIGSVAMDFYLLRCFCWSSE